MRTVLSACLLAAAMADLPIHCIHEEVMGTWLFELSENTHDNKELCGYNHPDANEDHFKKSSFEFVPVDSKKFTVRLAAGNAVYQAPDMTTTEDQQSQQGPAVASLSAAAGLLNPDAIQSFLEMDDKELVHVGTWTMVYDEGFETSVGGSKFFSFFEYSPKEGVATSSEEVSNYNSNCNALRVGWYHGPKDQGYGCFRATKIDGLATEADPAKSGGAIPAADSTTDFLSLKHKLRKRTSKMQKPMPRPEMYPHHVVSPFSLEHEEKDFEPSYAFVEAINSDESIHWNAKVHEQFRGKKMRHMHGLLGKRKYKRRLREGQGHGVDLHTGKLRVAPASAPHSDQDLEDMKKLPENFDWRNVDGVNYVADVKNQGSCGSCYALATIGAVEARLRIKDYNRHRDTSLSSQDVLSCSATNQGCEGGYPFLVTKYGEEYGLVDEECLPYEGSDSPECSSECHQQRYMLTNYRYVGDYYGGCNEAKMMREIWEGGPIVVAFEAPGELFYYDGGVFSGAKPKFESQKPVDGVNDWEQTNHAVLCVGWGVDPKKGKFWIMKNEWGKEWGEGGYFRIKRGTDECGIESMAVSADVYQEPEYVNSKALFR